MLLFSCGCISFEMTRQSIKEPGEVEHLIVWSCDSGHEDPFGVGWRNMHGKSVGPLPRRRAEELIDELSNLVADGQRFRELRALLRIS